MVAEDVSLDGLMEAVEAGPSGEEVEDHRAGLRKAIGSDLRVVVRAVKVVAMEV